MNKLLLRALKVATIITGLAYSAYSQTVPDVWFSAGKSTLAYAAKAGVVLDGKLGDVVWSKNAGYSTVTGFPNKIQGQLNWRSSSSATNNKPAADNYVGDASFGVAWDEQFLYVGLEVRNARIVTKLTTEPEPKLDDSGVELFVAGDNTVRNFFPSSGFDINQSPSQTQYPASSYQMQLGYIKSGLNKVLSEVPNGMLVNAGAGFFPQGSGVDAVVTEDAANDIWYMEIRLAWNSINSPFINEADGSLDDKWKPKAGRILGFDIGVSIPKSVSDPDPRGGFLSWNQCCVNRQWFESIHWGVTTLIGTPGPDPLESIALTPNPMNISDGKPVSFSVVATPSEASPASSFTFVNDNPSLPAIIVSPTGQVTPLNNGTATVTATALTTILGANAITTTSAVVNVSNQPSLVSISVNDVVINKNWEEVVLSVTPNPATAASLVRWELISGGELATLNTLTGLLTSLSTGNGTVRVKAIPIADPSKAVEKDINITKQVVLNSSNVTVTSFTLKPCGAETATAVTIGGYALSEDVTLRAVYTNPDSCRPQVVPSKYMSYNIRTPSNGPVLPTVIELIRGNETVLRPKTSATTIRVLGTYTNAPLTITSTFRFQQNAAACTIPGVRCVNGSTPGSVFATLDNSPVSIYPNPSTGDFSVKFDLAKGTDVTVSVLNAVGNTVSTSKQAVGAGVSEIAVSGATLPKGVYFVKVSTGNGQTAVKKLLIQ
mgnify:CR=1 FL=1